MMSCPMCETQSTLERCPIIPAMYLNVHLIQPSFNFVWLCANCKMMEPTNKNQLQRWMDFNPNQILVERVQELYDDYRSNFRGPPPADLTIEMFLRREYYQSYVNLPSVGLDPGFFDAFHDLLAQQAVLQQQLLQQNEEKDRVVDKSANEFQTKIDDLTKQLTLTKIELERRIEKEEAFVRGLEYARSMLTLMK
eukprot:GILJ01019988.1.p3 GENE.GILJ01019988.1~~GILJ01019988.1.p3  ORF type:complete len:194 (-),score=22.17 GILJ01019988.1:908-1489(-)